MKIFYSNQIKEIDKYTILNEPIKSIDLMERAAKAIFSKIKQLYKSKFKAVIIAGSGNNGGDGLALSRLLINNNYEVRVYLIKKYKYSSDNITNYSKLLKIKNINVKTVSKINELKFNKNEIIIDAIFGNGLNKEVKGFEATIINKINKSGCEVISIDVPSGLLSEGVSNSNAVVKANYTISLQFPKISFFFSENYKYTGEWHITSIGLSQKIIDKSYTYYYYIDETDIKSIFKKRNKFSHKGNFGHALLIAGSYGKAGASILAARACLKSGVGLLTTHIPQNNYNLILNSVPETMISIDKNKNIVTNFNFSDKFSAMGIGPGIGTDNETLGLLNKVLKIKNIPIIIDADGINLLKNIEKIPGEILITPHAKEFERLAGKSDNSYERHLKAIKFAKEKNIYIILKGAYTQIICPDGKCFFNSTGNQGMATAGSGDVLTGIILSLLAQGYSKLDACLLGVYLHGLSGDIALKNNSYESLIATDIIDNLGNAFYKFY